MRREDIARRAEGSVKKFSSAQERTKTSKKVKRGHTPSPKGKKAGCNNPL